MKKLNYTSEKDFVTEEIEFSDKQYEIIEKLHNLYKSERCSECTPILVRDDKKSLCFCIDMFDKRKNIHTPERNDCLYRITVEKIIN